MDSVLIVFHGLFGVFWIVIPSLFLFAIPKVSWALTVTKYVLLVGICVVGYFPATLIVSEFTDHSPMVSEFEFPWQYVLGRAVVFIVPTLATLSILLVFQRMQRKAQTPPKRFW
ncbi:MAG: hypothetical protein AAGH90_08245 [Pseudomonadota bacterium]